MRDSLLLAWNDIIASFVEIGFEDMVRPLLLLLWFGVLYIPLKNVDRRDFLSGLMFSMVLSGIGMAFLIAIPKSFYGLADPEIGFQVLMFLALAGMSSFRWFYRATSKRVHAALKAQAK